MLRAEQGVHRLAVAVRWVAAEPLGVHHLAAAVRRVAAEPPVAHHLVAGARWAVSEAHRQAGPASFVEARVLMMNRVNLNRRRF